MSHAIARIWILESITLDGNFQPSGSPERPITGHWHKAWRENFSQGHFRCRFWKDNNAEIVLFADFASDQKLFRGHFRKKIASHLALTSGSRQSLVQLHLRTKNPQ
jgi:hypothetical protein